MHSEVKLPRLSPAEGVKQSSNYLRGSILQELALDTPGFSKETVQILKFHGIYQYKDRDGRKSGADLPPSSMVRLSIPGGLLSPSQYLALDALADQVGDGSLRITTRQDIQFHRVGKSDLRRLMTTLNRNLLSTFSGCGDVVRNVTCCPAPLPGPLRYHLQRYARSLSDRLKPRTRALYEIWIDGEKTAAAQYSPSGQDEPLYGPTYLPRKFKLGLAAPGDNCIDIYSHDLGLVPVLRRGEIAAFTILAGGGLGQSPGVKASHPRLADPIGVVEPPLLEKAVEAVVTIHRDYGNRENRKLARLKYVVEAMGADGFRAEVESRMGARLAPAEPLCWQDGADHLGWYPQDIGLYFLGLPVASGRVRDAQRACLREIVTRFQPGVHLTPQQNLLLTAIPAAERATVDAMLREYRVPTASELLPVFRDGLACPALPTCGLAITEAERILPGVLAQVHRALDAAGLADEPIAVRMTGCPNGCARPYTAEIGIVGQSVDRYSIHLGGSHLGTRLGRPFAENVRSAAIEETLRPVFDLFRRERLPHEPFGDFCHRLDLAARAGTALEPRAN